MLSENIELAPGQTYIEDDSQDTIVLFRKHRIDEIHGDYLIVTRFQPNGEELRMLYGVDVFRQHMTTTEPTYECVEGTCSCPEHAATAGEDTTGSTTDREDEK